MHSPPPPRAPFSVARPPFTRRPVGGECCAARDTFQLCTGDLSNTTTLSCVNASSVSLGADGTVALGWDGGSDTPTSVRHAYSNYPQCALFNAHGLPSSVFVLPLTAGAGAGGRVGVACRAGCRARMGRVSRLRGVAGPT